MRNTMLTTATQQRNSQGNLQGNPQSETPPISIVTSPIAPIINAARIFSLRFTARMKRISAILIMSVLMVFLAACAGGGGGNGGTPPTPIGVLNFKVFPDVSSATLTWSNPNANITQISIIYQNTAAGSVEGQINITEITDSNNIRPSVNVTKVIPNLTNGANYTFSVTLELGGADEGKSVMARERTLLIGPNFDGDEYADAEDVDDDNDGVNDERDPSPRNASLSAFMVTELSATPGDESVNLSWNNPTAQIASINISYKRTGSDDELMTKISNQTTSGATNVKETITDLANGESYNFTVSLTLNGTDAGKEVAAQSVNATPNAFPISVSNLRVIPDVSSANLSWNNPDANITKISISYRNTAAGSVEMQINITEEARIRPNVTVTEVIPDLTNGTTYTFSVTLKLGGADENKSVIAREITRLIGPNLDGDEYADADPLELDIDGDGVGDNADNCPLAMNNGQNDSDNDMVGDACDVDANGNGLIEIATAQQLNQSRHNLLGSNFTRSAGGVGDTNGCGNGGSVTECNGYELIADIYLTTYANWQPIGSCMNYDNFVGTCTPTTKFFNATFDGNNHTINDLTITNHDGSYANAAGLFGAISSDSILRNIHIRSANLIGGGDNVGLLVGYAVDASIINSSAEGAVNASGNRVGGLVGFGVDAEIASSYAAGGSVSGNNYVGGLVGHGDRARITSSYAAGGAVSGTGLVGGLVGGFVGGLVGSGVGATIMSSYAAGGDVSGTSSVGGLVGFEVGATIMSSYAAGGDVSGVNSVGGLVGSSGFLSTITSSYAAGGNVSGTSSVGGLVGLGTPRTITASYWDSNKSEQTSSSGGGEAKTTSELQAPVHATGIYATWTSSCPGTNKPAWYFGTSTQYPVLTCHPNSDSDRDGVPDIIDTDDDGDGTLDTADAFPLNPMESVDTDNDGVGNNTDAFPADATESVDTDGDRVGDNADACDGQGAATGWTSDATTDKDGDGCRDSDEDAFPADATESMDTDGDDIGDNADNCPLVSNNEQDDFDNDMVGDACDVDTDGNGLIEIATAQELNQTRYNLLGSSFTRSAGGVGDANGCGNGGSVTECNGYELTNDISLADYANWQPIGSCMNYNDSSGSCTPTTKFFNAIFDGNNHTINDLTITNLAGSYAKGAGLFGAIGSDSILRNIHIRSGNISDGGNNVGLLVGYARGAMIINSSAEGAVNASGANVGGLVGLGWDAEITSSYAAGGDVSGTGNSVGGLVGHGRDAEITSSYAAGGAVTSSADNIGGLVGYGLDAEITSSYTAGGSVSGRDDVGGLVGDGFDSTITSSYAAGGNVSGANSVGGLVGRGAEATITSSYAAGGSVNGTGDNVGGLVGDGSDAPITSSYAAGGAVIGASNVGGLVGSGGAVKITSSYAAGGAVSGTGDNVGGLVGLGGFATITFSYWDSDKSGITEGSVVGESEGKTTSELQAPTSASGIYATWSSGSSGTCADGTTLTWNFGTASEYPALNCTPNGLPAQQHLRQR